MPENAAAKRYLRILGRKASVSRDKKSAGGDEFAKRAIVSADRVTAKTMTESGVQDGLAALRQYVENKASDLNGGEEDFKSLSGRVLKNSEEGLQKLRHDGPETTLTQDEDIGLEAVVMADGSRPAIEVVDHTLNLEGQNLGDWSDLIDDYQDTIQTVSQSIGRINLGSEHIGTGFMVAPGIIMTNRHVLQDLADRDENANWVFRNAPNIDFGDRLIPLETPIIQAGPDEIDGREIDFSKLDYALIKCTDNFAGELPPPLTLEETESYAVTGRSVYVMGYPAKPRRGTYKFETLMALFGLKYSVKRFSPGEIDETLGEIADDPLGTVIAHDCTTLGGNSGSPMVDFGQDGARVIGLHFCGSAGGNFAHAVATLKEEFSNHNVIYV